MTLEPQELTLNLRCQDEMLDKTSRQRMQNEFNVCSALGSHLILMTLKWNQAQVLSIILVASSWPLCLKPKDSENGHYHLPHRRQDRRVWFFPPACQSHTQRKKKAKVKDRTRHIQSKPCQNSESSGPIRCKLRFCQEATTSVVFWHFRLKTRTFPQRWQYYRKCENVWNPALIEWM